MSSANDTARFLIIDDHPLFGEALGNAIRISHPDARVFEATSIKGRVLGRDPRISICVDDQTPPYSYVMLLAEAQLSDDLAELKKWASVVGGRYMGADRAEEYGSRNAVPGEFLVRARITKVIAYRDIAS